MAVTILNGAYPKPPKKITHPEITIDKMEVFGRLRFSNAQIGDWYSLTAKQIAAVRKRADMRAAYSRGAAEVAVALRQKQIEMALAGNVTLLIHAGFHFADQTKDGPIPEMPDHDPGRFSWDTEFRDLMETTRKHVMGGDSDTEAEADE